MRYAYVKNGDAVVQTRRVLSTGRRTGPDAYIGSFLAAHESDEVLVLCRSRPAERFESLGVSAESYPGPSWASGMLRRLLAALRIGARIFAWRPDRIVCGCAQEMLWVAVVVARVLGVPIVASRHTGMPSRAGLRRATYWLECCFLKSCAGVICHGPFLSDQVREAGVDRSRVTEFSADLGEFAAEAPASQAPGGLASFVGQFSSIVLYVGRMQDDKGVIDLLVACSRLRNPGAERVGVVYVGEGEHVDRLREEIVGLGMAERVLILGRVPHHCLPAVMKCATVVATPTRPPLQEGRCKVVLEAFVMGVPVVAPSYAWFPYSVVHEKNGLLHEPGDIEGLTRCLDRILGDPDLADRLRQGAAESGRELLDVKLHDYATAVDASFRTGMPP